MVAWQSWFFFLNLEIRPKYDGSQILCRICNLLLHTATTLRITMVMMVCLLVPVTTMLSLTRLRWSATWVQSRRTWTKSRCCLTTAVRRNTESAMSLLARTACKEHLLCYVSRSVSLLIIRYFNILSKYLLVLGGGLAQLVTSLIASTKLINAGPG